MQDTVDEWYQIKGAEFFRKIGNCMYYDASNPTPSQILFEEEMFFDT
jgi:hypothetical protein